MCCNTKVHAGSKYFTSTASLKIPAPERMGKEDVVALDLQDGITMALPQSTPQGLEKVKDVGNKSDKTTWHQGKEPPCDMMYYA